MDASPGPGARRTTPPRAIRILLPVWGERHVGAFLDFHLPTMLAPGNIPALAQALPCVFVALTGAEDAPCIRRHPTWQHMARCCAVEIRSIDDLIMGSNHSTTITLAWEREIRSVGAAMTETCFFFLTSDYLIADGSLWAVLRRMLAGASAVTTGNFQIVAEDARERLELMLRPGIAKAEGMKGGSAAAPCAARHAAPVLALTARELMAFSLSRLHPATLANTVNYGALHNAHSNRLFWTVDEHTLIGRFFLMHMICIRPETAAFEIGASCDYSFVPELVPSGNVEVMVDSDDYLVVETQPREHESHFVRPGPFTPDGLAAGLAEWTTAGHRANSRATLVYHATAGSPLLAARRREADAFIADVNVRLAAGRPPQPHRGHVYWRQALAFYRLYLAHDLTRQDYAALARPAVIAERRPGGVLDRFCRLLLGAPPALRPWHPLWIDFHALRHRLDEACIDGAHALVVTDHPLMFLRWSQAQPSGRVRFASPDAFLRGTDLHPALVGHRFDVALVHIGDERVGGADVLIQRLMTLMAPRATILALVANLRRNRQRAEFRPRVAGGLARFYDPRLERRDARFVGEGRWRRKVQRALEQSARMAARHPLLLPLAAVLGVLLAPLSLLLNLAERLWPRGLTAHARWSSAFLAFAVREGASTADDAAAERCASE